MHKLLSLLITLLIAADIHAQTAADDSAINLLNSRQYQQAIQLMVPHESQRKSDAIYYRLLGEAYFEVNNLPAADTCFTRAISLETYPTWITAWSYYYLGNIALIRKDTTVAVRRLNTVIQLHRTRNSVQEAETLLDKITAHPTSLDFRHTFKTIASAHIDFHFQDTIGRSQQIDYYISSHEAAYTAIVSFFHATLPQKAQLYVWFSEDYFIACNKRTPGFTRPKEYTCYVMLHQSIGHELTHVLSYWAGGTPTENISSFLNEGIAIHFDMNNTDHMPQAKAAAMAQTEYRSVKDMWQSTGQLNDAMYPVAGAFINYLFTQCTVAQLLSIFHDQSYAHFTKVAGTANAEAIIGRFDQQVFGKK